MDNLLKTACLAFLLAFSLNLMAQPKFSAGGRLGMGFSTLPELDDAGGRFSFTFGGSFNYNFVPFLGIAADAMFFTSGGSYSGLRGIADDQGVVSLEKYNGDIRFIGISIPVYPQVSLGNKQYRVILLGGASTDFNLIGYEDRTYEDPDIETEVKEISREVDAITFSALFGAGFKLKLPEDSDYLQIDFRTNIGLNELYTTTDNQNPTAFKRNLFTLSATYFF